MTLADLGPRDRHRSLPAGGVVTTEILALRSPRIDRDDHLKVNTPAITSLGGL